MPNASVARSCVAFASMGSVDVPPQPFDLQIKTFLAIQSTDALVVHNHTLPAQGNIDAVESISNACSGGLPDAVPEKPLVITD